MAVSGASTGSGTPVTTPAIHHDRPAANPDLATTPISVDVGGVHETASTTRCHNRRRRLSDGCETTANRVRSRYCSRLIAAS